MSLDLSVDDSFSNGHSREKLVVHVSRLAIFRTLPHSSSTARLDIIVKLDGDPGLFACSSQHLPASSISRTRISSLSRPGFRTANVKYAGYSSGSALVKDLPVISRPGS